MRDKFYEKGMIVVWLVGISAGMMMGALGMANGKFGGLNRNKKEEKVEVVKYWYVQELEDYDEVLHVDRKCNAILKSKVVWRRKIGSDVGGVYLCPMCVDDERYDRIRRMMKENENTDK